MTGEMAWLILGVGVLGYEISAKEEQLLSEAVDRFIIRHPWVTRAVVVYLAAHLLNVVPDRFDPLHQLALRRLGLPWGARVVMEEEKVAQRGDEGAKRGSVALSGGLCVAGCGCADCRGRDE